MAWFTLGRKLDPRYKTNLWIAVASVAVVVSAWPATGSFASGLGLGAGFFLCWALAREVDPLNDLSAFVSAALFLVFSPLYDGIDLAVLFWVLLLLRLMSGICGKVPAAFDFAALLGLSGYLAWSKESPLFLIFLVASLFFAHWRYGGRRQTGTALLAAIPLSVAGVLLRPTWRVALLPGVSMAFGGVAATVLLGFAVADMRRREQTASDDLGNPLDMKWVALAVVFLVLVLSAFWAFGGVTIMTRLNLLASLAGVFFFDMVVCFRERRSP
ncbi:MAG: hypothetical protein ACP5DY_01735 [Thermovirgaceae bacterium]